MSQQDYLQGLSKQERIAVLQANATNINQGNYIKPLTADEIAARKDELAKTSILLMDLTEEFDKVKDAHKKQVKPLKETCNELLSDIRHGQTKVAGTTYDLPDYEAGIMETYNEDGEQIDVRKLRPNERQGGVFQMAKAN